MDAALKTEIQEIVELVKTVPEPLQLRAFEILLQDAIDRVGGKKRSRQEVKKEDDRDDADATQDKKKTRNVSASLKVSTRTLSRCGSRRL